MFTTIQSLTSSHTYSIVKFAIRFVFLWRRAVQNLIRFVFVPEEPRALQRPATADNHHEHTNNTKQQQQQHNTTTDRRRLTTFDPPKTLLLRARFVWGFFLMHITYKTDHQPSCALHPGCFLLRWPRRNFQQANKVFRKSVRIPLHHIRDVLSGPSLRRLCLAYVCTFDEQSSCWCFSSSFFLFFVVVYFVFWTCFFFGKLFFI